VPSGENAHPSTQLVWPVSTARSVVSTMFHYVQSQAYLMVVLVFAVVNGGTAAVGGAVWTPGRAARRRSGSGMGWLRRVVEVKAGLPLGLDLRRSICGCTAAGTGGAGRGMGWRYPPGWAEGWYSPAACPSADAPSEHAEGDDEPDKGGGEP
jgi:hypothetical protein